MWSSTRSRVQDENDQIYVYDGLHRGSAAKQVGAKLWVEVQPGTQLDAEWLALTANQKHGLRRSRECTPDCAIGSPAS
ncbi:MAG: hypothetical protein HS126_03385 [Anaerolineales bacterium]|nr:hypothetical protein [Anaerolineales bacterium]